jgi:hypothetical protein
MWIAIGIGLLLTVLIVVLGKKLLDWDARLLEEQQEMARNRLHDGYRYDSTVFDEIGKINEAEFERAKIAFAEHWERKAEQKEKWSDPPEGDDDEVE